MRSTQQNRLYHSLANQLWRTKEVQIWDGRFEVAGYPNPIRFRPHGFSYDSFRDLLKQCDLTMPKDEKGIALSSSKYSTEQMNSHITFIEVLLTEKLT